MRQVDPPLAISRWATATPPPWRLVLLIVVGIAAVLWTMRAQRREAELKELQASVYRAGGQVVPDWSVWRRASAWWQGQQVTLGTEVIFRQGRSRRQRPVLGDLRGLDIACLYVLNGGLTGDELERLVPAHPIQLLRLMNVTGADAVAHKLRESRTLRIAAFDDSDLTDAGLRELPLERIESLYVNGTDVSVAGLHELKRAEKLWCLVLDGRQFNNESVEIVKCLPKLRILGLNGAAVTDAHLPLLRDLKVEQLSLEGTSVTSAGITALKQALPGCTIEVR